MSAVTDGSTVVQKLLKDVREMSRLLTQREAQCLVRGYYVLQDYRIRVGNQIHALTKLKEPNEVLGWFFGNSEALEMEMKKVLSTYSQHHEIGRWAESICGIGPVLSAGLLAHIDLEPWKCANPDAETPCKEEASCSGLCKRQVLQTVGHIWSFAGLDPTKKWLKGERRPWNADLKVLCWKIGESFVKVKGSEKDIYGKLYEARKQYEAAKNAVGDYQVQAELLVDKFKRNTEARKYYLRGELPPGHIHSRAKRYAVKLFLAHWHHVAYEIRYGTKPPRPYVLEHMGHVNYMAPPNWPMVEW